MYNQPFTFFYFNTMLTPLWGIEAHHSASSVIAASAAPQIGLVRWNPTPPPGAQHGYRSQDFCFQSPTLYRLSYLVPLLLFIDLLLLFLFSPLIFLLIISVFFLSPSPSSSSFSILTDHTRCLNPMKIFQSTTSGYMA